MKRKMIYAGIPLLSGLLFASFSNDSNDYMAVPFIIILAFFLKYPVKMKNIEIAVCVISFSVGFSVYNISESLVYNRIISYSGQTVQFNGRIISISDYSGDKSSYILKGRINNIQNAQILYYGDTADVQYGDCVSVVCVLETFENKYCFNAADYYKSSGIFLRTSEVIHVDFENTDGFYLIRALWNYRSRIQNRIMSYISGDEGTLICAMLFGSKNADIDDNMRTALYRFGIGHVFAVSGFHLMVMASMINFLVKKLKCGKRYHLYVFLLHHLFLLYVQDFQCRL